MENRRCGDEGIAVEVFAEEKDALKTFLLRTSVPVLFAVPSRLLFGQFFCLHILASLSRFSQRGVSPYPLSPIGFWELRSSHHVS